MKGKLLKGDKSKFEKKVPGGLPSVITRGEVGKPKSIYDSGSHLIFCTCMASGVLGRA